MNPSSPRCGSPPESVRWPAPSLPSRRAQDPRPGRLAVVLLLFGVLAGMPPVRGADGLEPLSLRVGFTRRSFSGVNINDAEAAFKAFVQIVGRRRGYAIGSETRVFEEAEDLETAVRAGQIDIVIIDPWRFIAMDVSEVLTPEFLSESRGSCARRYVLIARRDAPFTGLADLRGREVAVLEMTNANLGLPWIETRVRTAGFGTAARFFGRVQVVPKASAAVLPVYFGQKSACVVDTEGLDLMKELNPQVGQALRAIESSEPMANGVVCLRREGWSAARHREDVRASLADLDRDPAGQQILTLFKASRLVPFDPAGLLSVRDLRAAHDRSAAREPRP